MPVIDPVEFAQQLIACDSVTPADGGAQAVLAEALSSIGFEVHRFSHGEAPDGPIENLFATRGSGGRHFAFAGHTDVVPPGEGWLSDPFIPTVRGDLLYGRGVVDMKGAIAAFVAAASRGQPENGVVSLIITGDEEGPATYGTKALMAWMTEQNITPDMILVGEPTSSARMGDTIKIGRRGSVNMWIDVPGVQGHVAYPHLASNPIPALAAVLNALTAMPLDSGTDWFQPSNLEITDVSSDNPAANVIPGHARARLNLRFNDTYRGEDLVEQVREIVAAHAPEAAFRARISGEAFLTSPGPLSTLVSDAISDLTGLGPELSTSGGTSDARFLSRIAPTVEFGLVNATMHKLDEAAAIPDIRMLADIYATIITRALAG
jgi:succinyl-diaminopimelate desuccinylase